RSLNSGIRLVVRSSQTNLNDLLHQRLANLIALDLAELPATAFALAAIGGETVGLFSVDGHLLRIVENCITPDHQWHPAIDLHDLNSHGRRVLYSTSVSNPHPIDFQGWDPSKRVSAGDLIFCVELNEPVHPVHPAKDAAANKVAGQKPSLRWRSIGEGLKH